MSDDLSRLLQPQNAASVVPAEAARSSAFPGIVLLYDNRPCAALGYSRESNRRIVLSQPVVLLNASDEVYCALCDQLLKRVKLLTAADGVRSLQFLQDESPEGLKIGRLLAAHGFIASAEILQWELTFDLDRQSCPGLPEADFPDDDRRSVKHLDIVPAESVSTQALQQSLGTILTSSDDLTALPLPTATELLMKWQQMQAHVFVCRMGQNIVGVMTCTTMPTESSSSQLTSERSVCIEYIGVVPSFQKQHIASGLILRIPELLSLMPRYGEALSLTVRAFADATNPSATQLYQRRGFIVGKRMTLWHCDLQRLPQDSDGEIIEVES